VRAQSSEDLIPAPVLLDTEASAGEQSAKRLPHFRLVITHCDHGLCCWHGRDSIAETGKAMLLDLGIVPSEVAVSARRALGNRFAVPGSRFPTPSMDPTTVRVVPREKRC